MPEQINQGIVAKQSLSEQELAAVIALAGICTQYEDIDLRLSWDALGSHIGDAVQHFLSYQDGALIGFLSCAGIGADEAEGTGMVDPEQRRKGVFRALVAPAAAECRRHGTKALVLVCDRRSAAAKAALEATGAQYRFSEHKMELAEADSIREGGALWARRNAKVETPEKLSSRSSMDQNHDGSAESGTSSDGRLMLQKASLEDADDIAHILAQDAGCRPGSSGP